MTAYDEGKQAYQDGKLVRDTPYGRGDMQKRTDWIYGWFDAKHQEQQEQWRQTQAAVSHPWGVKR